MEKTQTGICEDCGEILALSCLRGSHKKACRKTPTASPCECKRNFKVGSERLIPHFMKRDAFVLHDHNLKFIHNLGVQVGTKMDVSLKQSRWMYINVNDKLRTESKQIKMSF